MNHIHMILKAKSDVLDRPVDFYEQWVEDLISDLGMKLLNTTQGSNNPISAVCDTQGNEGVTVAGLIETSHVVLHTWNIKGEIQLDVYTCGEFNRNIIEEALDQISAYDRRMRIFDRKYDLIETYYFAKY